VQVVAGEASESEDDSVEEQSPVQHKWVSKERAG
jgi:hypothetical protein